MSSKRSCIFLLLPMTFANLNLSWSFCLSWRFSVCRSFRSIAFSSSASMPSGLDRLLEEVGGARLDGVHRLRDRPVARDDDHLRVGQRLLEPVHQVEPVHVGQHHVGDDRVGLPGAEDLLAAGADRGGTHLVRLVLEQDLEPLGHRRLVIDDEDPLLPFGSHVLLRERSALADSTSSILGSRCGSGKYTLSAPNVYFRNKLSCF